MKKITALFLLLAMLIAVFASCNQDEAQTPKQSEKQTEDPAQTERPTEDSKETEKPTDKVTDKATEEEKKSGCGGVIGMSAVVLTAILGLGVALKKKD